MSQLFSGCYGRKHHLTKQHSEQEERKPQKMVLLSMMLCQGSKSSLEASTDFPPVSLSTPSSSTSREEEIAVTDQSSFVPRG